MNNRRRLVAVPILAVALTACGSNDPATDDTEVRSTTATASSTTTRPAPATTPQPAARATATRPAATTVTSPVDTAAVDAALEVVGGDEMMRGYLTAISAAGIGANADELVTIALYTPSMCEMKTSMGMSDEDAATHVPDDLAANGITVTPAQAEALIWSANVHLC